MNSGSGVEHKKSIAKLYAFLGRYTHQQVWDMEKRTTKWLSMLARETKTILEEEKAQFDTLRSSD